jgi:hypothetical protein
MPFSIRSSAHVGDVRKGKTMISIQNKFAALGDSDSEGECPRGSLRKILADPVLEAMYRGETLWGDLMYEEIDYDHAALSEAQAAAVAEAAAAAARQESEIWDQSFGGNLGMYYGDAYDFRGLTDAEYNLCMSWLYEQGWELSGEDREGVKAWPANLPPRVWVGKTHPCVHHKKTEAKRVTVPRFCRTVGCGEATCRYVHEDTMPRLDKPCGFGANCGASDPTGVKRSQCLYMHPGETWSADLVIHRQV